MGRVFAQEQTTVAAEPQRVFSFLADYAGSRPRILTPHFSDYTVEEGGDGAGTVVSYRLRAGGRERSYRMSVEVPAEGTRLMESDANSSFVTTWSLSAAAGTQTTVTIASEWEGATGIAGFFERTFAPLGLRRIYSDMLDRLRHALESSRPDAGASEGPSGSGTS